MNWLSLQAVAQTSIERILNALPEGFLIAFFAWALLRVLRKQNSGTRFAVWFLALLTVAALPVLGAFGQWDLAGMSSGSSWGSMRSAITIPAGWGLFVFLGWAFGSLVALTRLAAGLWRLRQLRQSCSPVVAAELDPVLQETLKTIGASGKPVTIAVSDSVRVPAAIGFWTRTIVLPAWALRELPAEDLNVILLHESAHLRRGDDWTNLIQKIVRALFFFHPAVWWIESRLSVEREMACDDAVLAETSNPHGYANCLVSLLEKSLAHRSASKPWAMAQAAVNRAREATLRLTQILDTNRPAATRVWKPALGMAGVFSIVCLLTLPLAPQFVAFDRGMAIGNSGATYFASDPQPAMVIPAAWRTGESSSVETNVGTPIAKATSPQRAHARVRAQHVLAKDNEPAPSDDLIADVNTTPPGEQLIPASVSKDRTLVPEFQTLVFFEATRYADSPVWQVQVWRVTLLSGFRERMVRVPVAKSI